MDEMLVFIMVGAVIVALGIILWFTSRRQRESALDQMRAKSIAASPREPNTMVRVRELMARGEKIEAIKVLREATGMGLADAKAAVEMPGIADAQDSPEPSAPAPAQLPAELAATVRGLLQRGDKIEAIKLVRERMQIDLKDAKELVDSIK